MTMGLFRQEAVQAHEGTKERGDILRFERRWETVAVKVVAIAAVVGFLFASLFGVDEYAKGAAVVRIDGRRVVTALGQGTIDAVSVTPGQSVLAGAVLAHMSDTDERAELLRAESELELQLAKMLRDPNDASTKQAVVALRARRDQAKNAVESRYVRATIAGVVSDVRAQVGHHVGPGDVIATVTPSEGAKASLVMLVSAEYLPMLREGQKVRFELDGFRYEYQDMVVSDVSSEGVGPLEAQRVLGQEREGAVSLQPGAKVLVRAKLPASSFQSNGHPYGYFDGLTGTAEIRVRREPLLVTLLPALRAVLP
ncbi:MAG: HlyD family efflux transporter periplasmic adaptor subunit [Polyangiaceae bacterium]